MRAQVHRVELDTILLTTADDTIISVPKDKINIDCKEGDIVFLENIDGKDYYFSAEKPSIKKKKHVTKALIIILCMILLSGAIASAIVVPRIIKEKEIAEEENRRREIEDQLDSCLFDGYNRLHPENVYIMEISDIKKSIFSAPMTNIYIGEKSHAEIKNEEYDMAMTCYNNFQVDDYQDKIAELQSYKNEADLSICIGSAQKSSNISDEEADSSKNNIVETIALLARISNGYQEQINCYEKYGTDKYESNIIDLRTKKAEIDSVIESAKNSANSNSSRTNIYCTTNTIGNYTYTSCY